MPTVKELVYKAVCGAGYYGVTVPEFLLKFPTLKPQTVYPCFTILCRDNLIRDGQARRRHVNARRSIVWIDAKYGGVKPEWGTGSATYNYRGRAATVIDHLYEVGPSTVPEIVAAHQDMAAMSTYSLVSRLVAQGWVYPTRVVRKSASATRKCRVYALTGVGRALYEASKAGALAAPHIKAAAQATAKVEAEAFYADL